MVSELNKGIEKIRAAAAAARPFVAPEGINVLKVKFALAMLVEKIESIPASYQSTFENCFRYSDILDLVKNYRSTPGYYDGKFTAADIALASTNVGNFLEAINRGDYMPQEPKVNDHKKQIIEW